ncbi:hypothetical protein RYZ26_00450 [Terasakiella sp. A23]|uniref:hypothetical protein n=1 Tax=Terasakiella sp. FCG-A23 TaxID=3080561 RepID=UPI0029529EC7|nr:hypothetical protein [Terasakiella sp. A23]MDV7338043.1 hypothetical protein [Terasakiella sp. A23]
MVLRLLCVLVLLMTSQAQAQEYDFDLIIPLNPENFGDSTEQLEGPTGQVIAKVLRHSEPPISYRYSSPTHGYGAFFKGKYACVTPDAAVYHDPEKGYIESLPIHDTHWVAVYHKDTPKILQKNDLLGKTVGLIYRQHTMGDVIPQVGAKYEFQPDIKINLKKLVRKRMDALVVPLLGLDTALATDPSFSQLSYTSTPPLATIPDRIMCHDTKRGREVIEIVNKVIPKVTK